MERFDQTDRRAVIRKLEDALGVRLSPVGRRRKWLKDEGGKSYWVLGGYGEWHGVPEEMMDSEVREPSDGFLVIAFRQTSAIEIYMGPLLPLVADRAKLYRARKTTGDYQFTCRKRATGVVIDQCSAVSLPMFATFDYSADSKASDKRIEEAGKLFDALSEEQKESVIRSLRERQKK